MEVEIRENHRLRNIYNGGSDAIKEENTAEGDDAEEAITDMKWKKILRKYKSRTSWKKKKQTWK